MKERQITIRESPNTRSATKRASTSRELQPKRQRTTNDVDRFPSLRTRMSPADLYNFIKDNPSDEQLQVIKDMGFGGLLQIQTDTIPGQLAYCLASNFDPYKSSLMDGQLPIQDIDIHIALGIPMGSRVVDEAVYGDKSEEFSSEVEKWKLQYKKDKKIESKDILAKMKTQRDGDEDFKRNFIVYFVSSFLGGVKSSIVSLKVLKCLKNVAEIPLFNWCEFTKIKFVENVISWQKEEVRREIGKENVFKGPIMVLVYIYLDRVVFKLRTVPRSFPTICSWLKESITDRIKQEKKFTKTFGKGYVDYRMIIKEEHANDKPTSSSPIHELPDSLAISKMVSIADAMAGGFVSSQHDENKGVKCDKNGKGKKKMDPSNDEYEDEQPEENENQNVGDDRDQNSKDPWDDESFWGN
ncbi:hypothetical protein RND81_05G038000 [Saponaria officinalis]|uniref:Uncharacterized protein n=1 Tax=Saponaria officinalis TaxID=3572 RepID=A0AAW1KV89_SAPOF